MRPKCLAGLVGLLTSLSTMAEPTSSALTLSYVRPYGGGNTVFLGANISSGAFCASNVYSIDVGTSAGKAMFAVALTAITTGKQVKLELLTCASTANGASALQSIYLLE
jgi:hypothetical protein